MKFCQVNVSGTVFFVVVVIIDAYIVIYVYV